MEKTVLKIEWPLESDDVLMLSLSEAKQQFPDFFDSSDWVDQICNVTKLPLIDLIDSARVGDVFYSQFCEVTLVEKETLEAVAPCQECGEEVAETEALGDANDWFCPDCYGENRKMKEKISRMEQISKRNHAQVLKIAQWGPGEARIFLQSRGVKWANQKALGLFRRCVAFVEQHPKSHAVEKFTNPWHGDHLGFFFTSLANPERPEWMLDRCVNIEGVK